MRVGVFDPKPVGPASAGWIEPRKAIIGRRSVSLRSTRPDAETPSAPRTGEPASELPFALTGSGVVVRTPSLPKSPPSRLRQSVEPNAADHLRRQPFQDLRLRLSRSQEHQPGHPPRRNLRPA